MSIGTRRSRASCEAWQAGRPLPRYDTIHHAIMPPDQAMIVAFVRMAGESRPWGIAWGTVGSEPTIESVPDGRVRDDVAGLCADVRRGPAGAPARPQLDVRPGAAEAGARRPAAGVAPERPARRDAAPAQLHLLADQVRRRQPGHPARARPGRRAGCSATPPASATSTSSAPASSSATPTSSRRRTPAPRTSASSSRGSPPRATAMPGSPRPRGRGAHRLADDGSGTRARRTRATS